MIAGALRLASTVATIVVALGFLAFAYDEVRAGSEVTVARIADPGAERDREEANGQVRELIDDANDVLLEPFTGLVSGSGSAWVRHGVTALLALLLYGFGLRALANAIPQPRRAEALGWETPR